MPALRSLALCAFVLASLPAARAADPYQMRGDMDDLEEAIKDQGDALKSLDALYTEDRKAFYASLEKSETLGGILGGVVGFGAGCFYGQSSGFGDLFLGAESVVVGAAVVFQLTGNPDVVTILLVGDLGLRVAGAIAGVAAVSDYNEDLHSKDSLGALRNKVSLVPAWNPRAGGPEALLEVRL